MSIITLVLLMVPNFHDWTRRMTDPIMDEYERQGWWRVLTAIIGFFVRMAYDA